VEQQCKALGIYEQVQAGINSSSLNSTEIRRLNSTTKDSQLVAKQRKNQELKLANSKKLGENLFQKIQALE
jgi:hypothetical protein